MKKFFEKYKNIIVVVLFVLLCMTKCSSCMDRRASQFENVALLGQIDSIKNINDRVVIEKRFEIDSLQHVIDVQRSEIDGLKNVLQNSKATTNRLWEANKQLVEKSNNIE